MSTHKFKITHQQGQTLFQLIINFVMPEKLGTGEVSIAERKMGADEVGSLYRALRAYSPLYQKSKKFIRFGPPENWDRAAGSSAETWTIRDLEHELTIRLDDDSLMGVFRVLVTLLHPGSNTRAPVGMAEEQLWPLAERLRITGMLKKETKVEGENKRRLELDDEKDEEKEELPEPGKGSPPKANSEIKEQEMAGKS